MWALGVEAGRGEKSKGQESGETEKPKKDHLERGREPRDGDAGIRDVVEGK